MFCLRGNSDFCTFLCGICYYLQVTIIDLSSPIGASLYNIGTRIRSQRTAFMREKHHKNTRNTVAFDRKLIGERTFL